MLKPKTPLAAAEADLTALTKRGSGLEQRRDTAAAALATATAERRRLLTETDDPSATDLAKADRTVRDATDAHAAAVDGLAAVDDRVAEVRATIARLTETAERERQAAAIEASAKAADVAIERIRRAAGELESARRDLAAALLPEAAVCYAPPAGGLEWGPQWLTTLTGYDHHYSSETHETLDAGQVAARIVGHLASAALPGLGIARLEDANLRGINGKMTPVLAPVDGESVRSLLTDPMRAVAAKARGGLALAPPPGTKPIRRRADRWTTDAEGRSIDSAGVQVTNGGFYLDDASQVA